MVGFVFWNAQETLLGEKMVATDDIQTKVLTNVESIHLLNQQVEIVRKRRAETASKKKIFLFYLHDCIRKLLNICEYI